MKIKKKVILFFSNYLPLQIWTLRICNHDISKTITARNFKLGLLIEDDEYSAFAGSGSLLLMRGFQIFAKRK